MRGRQSGGILGIFQIGSVDRPLPAFRDEVGQSGLSHLTSSDDADGRVLGRRLP